MEIRVPATYDTVGFGSVCSGLGNWLAKKKKKKVVLHLKASRNSTLYVKILWNLKCAVDFFSLGRKFERWKMGLRFVSLVNICTCTTWKL